MNEREREREKEKIISPIVFLLIIKKERIGFGRCQMNCFLIVVTGGC
jgi:hypothetical protein